MKSILKPYDTSLLRFGLWFAAVPMVAISIGLAALHFYQQARLRDAVLLTEHIVRSSNDIFEGFLHLTLTGPPGSPWQPAQGYAMLQHATSELEQASALLELQGPVIDDWRRELSHLRELLAALDPSVAPDQRILTELNQTLFQLVQHLGRLDQSMITSIEELHGTMTWTFLSASIGAGVLLSLLLILLYRAQRGAMLAVQLVGAITKQSSDPIFVKDRDGKYLLYNDAGAKLLNRHPKDILGKDDSMIFDPEFAAVLRANDAEVMATRRAHTYEEEMVTPAGTLTFLATKTPLIDRAGRVVGTFGICRNITQRKQEERSLLASHAQLETVIESLDEGILLIQPDGKFKHWNRAALHMHDLSDDAHIESLSDSRQVFLLYTPEGRQLPIEERPANRVLRGERLRALELIIRRANTDWERRFIFGGTLIKSPEDNGPLIMITITDVTPQRRTEEAMRRLQRMEALGTLAAGIAHDFNNILLAISGNSTLAQADLPADHPAFHGLKEIERASARATDLVKRILLFSRSQESQRSPAQLDAIVEEALMLLRPTISATIEFRPHIATSLPAVLADASQLHQVIVNLVTNSVYAIAHAVPPRHGCIDIEVQHLQVGAGEHLDGHPLAPGHYVRLTITDNGSGMDAPTLTKVFDPFFTTKPTGEGTGLGMAVVHGIVRNHEGALAVESELGVGTKVTILLPAVTNVSATAETSATARRAQRSKSIMYIDDEESLVQLAERFLQRLGHQVRGFTDAPTAIRAFQEAPDAYDVVLTDLSMPQLSGFDVASALLATRADVMVIMMSGFVRPEDRERALRLGIRDLLLKPSSMQELAQVIDRLFDTP